MSVCSVNARPAKQSIEGAVGPDDTQPEIPHELLFSTTPYVEPMLHSNAEADESTRFSSHRDRAGGQGGASTEEGDDSGSASGEEEDAEDPDPGTWTAR
jgi:hypothetical protein